MVVCSIIRAFRLIVILVFIMLVFPGNFSPVLADATYSISGSITPAFSVSSVKFADGAGEWPGVIAEDGLTYKIDGLTEGAEGSVTAEPAAGYTLEPENGYSDVIVGMRIAGLDFRGIPVMYTISGNAGVALAVIHIAGSEPVTADENGRYTFTVPYNWSGLVVPTLTGYSFNPENKEFTPIQSDQEFNFSAEPAVLTISGNAGISGAVLVITGLDPITCGEDGSYHFTVPSGWSGTVSVSLEGFTFNPVEQEFVDVREDRTLSFSPEPLATVTPLPTETSIPTNTQEATPTTGITPSFMPIPSATTTPQKKVNSIEINAVGPGTYDDISSDIQYSAKWSLIRTSGPINRTDHYTRASGAEASLVFNGTRVDYYYVKYRTRGHVRVTIDGNHMADLDLYSKKLQWRQKWTSPALDMGIHTITITRLDGIVDLDAFIIYGDETPQPTPVPTRTVQNTSTPVVPTNQPPTSTSTTISVSTQTALPPNTPTAMPTSTGTPVPTTTPIATSTPTATSTSTTTNTPTTTPTVAAPTPTSITSGGGTVFLSDFESGDFSTFDGSAGEIFGKGTYYDLSVVSSPAIGSYSAALTIGSGRNTAAYLFTYAVPTTDLGVYSVDMYVPGNIVPDDWWNVMQWKSVDNTYNKPVIHMNILGESGNLMLYMFYTAGGVSSNPDVLVSPINPIPFPTDRWVNITGYYMAKSDSSGFVEIYQDGVKVYDMRGFMSKPGDKDVLWSVNSYADRISPNPATIYVDNMKIAGE